MRDRSHLLWLAIVGIMISASSCARHPNQGPGTREDFPEPVPVRRTVFRVPEKVVVSGIEARLVVELTVEGDGSVGRVRILESDPPDLLDEVVAAELRNWRYEPFAINGRPVRRVAEPITFFVVYDDCAVPKPLPKNSLVVCTAVGTR